MSDLGPNQEAILRAIATSEKSALDARHFTIDGQTKTLHFKVGVSSKAGFDVWAVIGEEGYTLGADGWHAEFRFQGGPEDNARQLLERLRKLLDGRTQLIVRYAGRTPYQWQLLHNSREDQWESLGVTGLIFYNYFARRRTAVKRNGAAIDEGV